MKKRNRKIRSAMAAALAVSMVAAPCSSALAASTSDEITQREIDNAALAREAAGQGMVLLENENHTLPLKKMTLFRPQHTPRSPKVMTGVRQSPRLL